MTKNKRSNSKIAGAALVLPLLVLLLVGGSTLILAQPHGRGGDFEDRGPMLERIMEKLELSPAQEEEIHELLAENRDEHQAQWQAVKTARRALSDQIHATDFNEGAIREAAAAVADIEEELAVSRALKFHEVQQILTPEQQAQMREMMETMRDFREEWGGRHRGQRGRG
jgi:Spy/CpxP family protein refolding chaperone